jgi:hypothetical protein
MKANKEHGCTALQIPVSGQYHATAVFSMEAPRRPLYRRMVWLCEGGDARKPSAQRNIVTPYHVTKALK